MIKFNCPHCSKPITAPDEYAGKKGKCPGCKKVVTIEDPDVLTDLDVVEEPKAAPAPAAKRAVKPPSPIKSGPPPAARRRVVAADDAAEEEVLEAEEVEEEEEEEEERPRKRKKKPRRKGRSAGGWRGEYADCPDCGAPGDASRLFYTWWGGFIGPMIICTVRCNRCGTVYNGNSGNYNTVAIAIWVGVSLAIGVGFFLLAMMLKAV